MKVITMSNKKFELLRPLEIPNHILNTEAKLFELKHKGESKLFKKLYINNGPSFGNKLYTLEMLDMNKKYLPDNFSVPDYLVSVAGIIQGFTVPRREGIELSTFLITQKNNFKEDIYYLKKVGEILEQLEYIRKCTPLKSLYINDLHESNFIVNNDKRCVYVIDLDSSKIGENQAFPAKLLVPNYLLKTCPVKYELTENEIYGEHIKINNNTDLYCYIIMILNYLYGKNISNITILEFYEYLNYLDRIGMNKELLDIFNNLVVEKDNTNPVNYLDTITNEQICRAKEFVFKKTSKNLK